MRSERGRGFCRLRCGFFALAIYDADALAHFAEHAADERCLLPFVPAGVNAVAVSMVLHGSPLFCFWTALGIILGLVLLGMEGAAAGVGSLNAPFTLFVAALVLAIFAPLVAIMAPAAASLAACAVVTVLVYGWLMPYLADWSQFESRWAARAVKRPASRFAGTIVTPHARLTHSFLIRFAHLFDYAELGGAVIPLRRPRHRDDRPQP